MNTTKNKISSLLHPFYLVNVILSSSFLLTKTINPVCNAMYKSCEFEMREYELFVMLACFVTLKNKRNANILEYLAHFCLFAKICNIIMFGRHSASYAIVYGLIWLIQAWLITKPVYSGPEKIFYFRDTTFNSEVLNHSSKTYWLITFYTAWSPACIQFAPVFAELSYQYGLSNLKFGKLDVTRYADIAHKLKVDTSSWSNQLPTVILFTNGQEVERRPGISPKGKVVQKYIFTIENIVSSFDLNNLHQKLKSLSKSENEEKKCR